MPHAPNSFEYKIRQTDYHGDAKSIHLEENVLSGVGSDGWELVAAVPIVEGGKTVKILHYMVKQSKRSMI